MEIIKSKQYRFLFVLFLSVVFVSLIGAVYNAQIRGLFFQPTGSPAGLGILGQSGVRTEEGDFELFLPIIIVSHLVAEPTHTPSFTPTSTPQPVDTPQSLPSTQTPTPAPTRMPVSTPTSTPTPISFKPFYGIQYAPAEDFSKIKEFGFEVVLQDFAHDGSPEQWLNMLDMAEAADMQVVGWLWPPGWEYDGDEWDIDAQAELFIETVADHPALFAVYSLHEPYWNDCQGCGYTTAELQQLYNSIKEIRDVPVYADMDELVLWAEFSDETVFADGVCDYCAVWYYPAKRNGAFRLDLMVERLDGDLALMKANAPNSEFIWSMQAFSTGGGFNLRMPTAQEMKEIAEITYSRDIYGAWWYPWDFDPNEYDDYLARRPDLHATLHEIYTESVLPAKMETGK